MEGWTDSTAGARTWNDLPAQAVKYVRHVEELIGADLSTITGVGRMRDTAAAAPPADPPEPRSDPSPDAEPAQASATTRPPRRRQNRIADQLDLFKSDPRSG